MERAGREVGGQRARWLWPIAWACAALALYLTAVTLWTVWTARSEVPWRDQWTYLDDAREILAHNWSRLWYSYWGHRVVISRLAAVADVRFFDGLSSPILALELAIQAAHAALLVWIAWRLFYGLSRPVFLILAAVIVQLCFSSLQMENFIWAADPGYLLVWTTATAGFLLLAMYAEAARRRHALLAACFLCGVTSTLSCPNGVFLWPVLLLQAWSLRLNIRVRGLLALIGALTIGIYFRGYDPGPALGMGVKRAILHPEQSIPIVGMLAAATLTSVSVRAATIAGSVALVFAAYILLKVWRYRPPALLTVYGALSVFALLTLAGMMTSRISPEFVAERVRLHLLVFPSRYYTTVFFFWAAIAGISLWMAIKNRREWPQLAGAGSMVAILTVGTLFWQIGEAANWRGYYRELDVAGSALIMHVNDPANPALAQIYPDPGLRNRVSAWLEQGKLAVFSQSRARLPGQRIAAAGVENDRCRGAAQTAARVSDGLFRITGWAVDSHTGRPPRDLVFANRLGIVVGVARSGLRRPDLAGTIGEASPATIGWQGYARAHADVLDVYGVLDRSAHYCRVGPPITLPIE